MARIVEPTPEQERKWKKWVEGRPENVRSVAERFDPWSLYRLKSTGQRVTVYSFGEEKDGSVTLTVDITGEFNYIVFDRQVFGIDPNDLEPCDLPAADELLGTLLSPADVKDHIDALRVSVRPDLWKMGPDGKAVRVS